MNTLGLESDTTGLQCDVKATQTWTQPRESFVNRLAEGNMPDM